MACMAELASRACPKQGSSRIVSLPLRAQARTILSREPRQQDRHDLEGGEQYTPTAPNTPGRSHQPLRRFRGTPSPFLKKKLCAPEDLVNHTCCQGKTF